MAGRVGHRQGHLFLLRVYLNDLLMLYLVGADLGLPRSANDSAGKSQSMRLLHMPASEFQGTSQ